ncbi:zinc finger protein 350-like [Cheilinus undulatus]|uniref:zinc finger protein 350-like n=1 Tax=Cheilinus undulatus TaxID=241271 RepID=UPI001BD439D0|nr:zinc finger protein 350-like [Cheilinus undulatus]
MFLRDYTKMSKVQLLRSLVNQRLAAAAEEIFELFERTIAEYEEELRASKEGNHRQHPEVQSHRAVFPVDVQQCSMSKEEVPPEQLERASSLSQQEPPKSAHIKETTEELWSSQEEDLQGSEEAPTIKSTFACIPVKIEYDAEIPQSSHLHLRQTEEMETGADGEDCRRPGAARHFDPERGLQTKAEVKIEDFSEPETDDSVDWNPHSDSNPAENTKKKSTKTDVKSHHCPECDKRYYIKGHLTQHMRTHTGERPFGCSVCGKTFRMKSHLTYHSRKHTGEKPFGCSQCSKRFNRKGHLVDHLRIHTGEKPFSCSECGKCFNQKGARNKHMQVHTRKKACRYN